jgi:hypothetical protein
MFSRKNILILVVLIASGVAAFAVWKKAQGPVVEVV